MGRWILCFASLWFVARQAEAATYVVNNTGDTDDAAADATCDDGTGKCTLRAAITQSNRDVAADVIQFGISGSGVKTITVGSDLPQITQALTIDGTTQPGYAGNPLIEINGNGLSPNPGMYFVTGTNVLAGVAIFGFTGSTQVHVQAGTFTIRGCYVGIKADASAGPGGGGGISVGANATGTIGGSFSNDANVISATSFGINLLSKDVDVIGNRIGTNPAGTAAIANTIGINLNVMIAGVGPTISSNVISGNDFGVYVTDTSKSTATISANFIGLDATGTSAVANSLAGILLSHDTLVEQNTISGNGKGIELALASAAGSLVRSNLIGTNASGTTAVANTIGISIEQNANNNLIGGPNASDRNVIAGNTQFGIAIVDAGTVSNVIRGNRIGLDVNGTARGNGTGIYIANAGNLTIAANEVASSAGKGIVSIGSGFNVFTQNSLHDNVGLGIDLGNDGVTANDAGDADTGPNGLQNFPSVVSAVDDGTSSISKGTISTAALTMVTVELFASSACDGSGFGEASQYLGNANIMTNAAGDASWSISGPHVPAGYAIVATATAGGSTSELSMCQTVASCSAISISPTSVPGGVIGTLYSQALTASGSSGSYTYTVSAGAPPPGITLATDGTLAGTPTAAGSYNFTVLATDGLGCSGARAYTLDVCPMITLAPTSIADGSTASVYNVSIMASGGTAPYAYTVSSGALPAGTALSSGGAFTGTASASGDYSFTVTATDDNACTGSLTYDVTITTCALAIDPATLTAASVGTAYDVGLAGTGGTAPVSFVVTSGTLPPGLSLNNGHVAGTPTAAGMYSFSIAADDALSCTASQAFSLAVTCPSLAIAPATLDAATAGDAYAATFSTTGGSAPYTYNATGLAPGLSLSSAGEVTGTPSSAGDYTVAITSTDVYGCMAMVEFALTVGPEGTKPPTGDGDGGGCCESGKGRSPVGSLTLALLVLVLVRRRRGARPTGRGRYG